MKFVDKDYWSITTKEAIELQEHLKNLVILNSKIKLNDLKLIAATDVSYYRDSKTGKAVIVLWDYKKSELIDYSTFSCKVKFPYIPGLLSFRECPLIIEAFKKLSLEPELIITDGQGIAHPRRMGEATHLGLITEIPTIGCAKSKLYGIFEEPNSKKGSYTILYDFDGSPIGAVLRSKDNTKPIFVSPGYMIDLDTSLKVILNLISKFRIPDPLRMAHTLSKR
jgi:deoxyribonuclease V